MSVKFNFKSLTEGFEIDWPVIVKMPKDGGETEEQTFMARFHWPTPEEQAEIDAIVEQAGPSDADKRAARAAQIRRSVEIVFVGLAESEGERLTPELFDAMWGSTGVSLALIKAVGDFRSGVAAKNSSTPAGSSPPGGAS